MQKKMNIEFLEKLTNAFGPSGHEHEVQKMVKEYGQQFADEILYDKTGSIIFKHGSIGPKIMLAGHADEIGYIISAIEDNGFLKISNLGGLFPPFQPGQEILIRPFKEGEKIIGIIQMRLPSSIKDMNKVPKIEELYVDIGCASRDEVEELGIQLGDPAVPLAKFRVMERKRILDEDSDEKNDKTVKLAVAKAFDDRIGVFMGLEVLRRLAENDIKHPNQVYISSTTQEEVGLRGARTAARLIQPDIGFSLDVTKSADVPGAKGHKQSMGKGPVLSVYDRSMIPNPFLRKFVMKVARKNNIKFQNGFLNAGGTDAGIIHLTGLGAPSLFVGIATRYVHTHHSMLELADVESTISLLVEIIKELDENVVKGFTQI